MQCWGRPTLPLHSKLSRWGYAKAPDLRTSDGEVKLKSKAPRLRPTNQSPRNDHNVGRSLRDEEDLLVGPTGQGLRRVGILV
jgi:hypothetical protein